MAHTLLVQMARFGPHHCNYWHNRTSVTVKPSCSCGSAMVVPLEPGTLQHCRRCNGCAGEASRASSSSVQAGAVCTSSCHRNGVLSGPCPKCSHFLHVADYDFADLLSWIFHVRCYV